MNHIEDKFSVLLPILDRKDIIKGFPKALESIFNNSLIPDQVVVTIDGEVSSDSRKLIEKFQNQYLLDLLWIPQKVGLDKALNLGLLECRNEIIFRADGDDINLRDRFKLQLQYLLDGFDLVGSNIDEYNEQGEYISTKKVPLSDKDISRNIIFRNPINHMTVGFKKSKVMQVGGYPELFLKGDYGLWIKLKAADMKFINLNLSLVKATTGKRMIKDRGGLEYIKSEYCLQVFLLRNGFGNIFISLIIFLLRSFLFILPVRVKYFFYINFLRTVNKS